MTAPAQAPATLSVKQQDSILDSVARINVWHGSIRSGKTIASIVRWLLFVRTAPPGPLAMIGKTRETIYRNVVDVMADMLPGAVQYTRGAPTIRVLGRLVHVIGANDARAEGRLRGLTLAGAYVDEITLVPEPFFTQLLGRLSLPGSKLFGSTNPDSPAHWFKRKYLDRSGELDLYAVHFALADNPGLSRDYIASLEAEFTGLWHARFILGRWVAAEGAVYDMLTEGVHTAPAPPPTQWVAAWVGLDYGTSNSTHAVLLALVDQGGPPRLHVVAEWEHNGRARGQLTDAQLSARLAAWVGPLTSDLPAPPVVALDPSAASLRTQMRADGWPQIKTADNRVEIGLRVTASLFAAGRLVVDPERCPVLWQQLQGYVWDPAALDRGVEQPLKENDHGPDALRYAVMQARRVWRAWMPNLAAQGLDELATPAA